ncbi:MAG: diguanylate cyclase [Sodalinema sp.]|uniref:diguanylate cyclase domain-containing protein n=1 Tax=Sodalinema sp. TaxID=3080550 RepID=UPI00121986F0|nr:MAG: diguanylate cyclase [Phormidium sp. SL48-SHIP]
MRPVRSSKSIWDLLEHLCECICRFDPDGRIIIANAAFEQAFPAPVVPASEDHNVTESASGRGTRLDSLQLLTRLPEGDRSRLRSACQRISSTQQQVTLTLLNDDIGEGWHWTIRGIFNGVGEVLEYQAIIQPLSGLKGVEEDLLQLKNCWQSQQEASRYQLLATYAPVGIFQADPKGDLTFVNPRWCEIAGMSATSALKEGWKQAIHPDDIDRVLTVWNRIQEGLVSCEFRFVTPGKREVWVLGSSAPLYDQSGQFSGAVGTVLEITERKQAELQQSQLQQLSRALEQCGDNVIITDREGEIVYVNSGFERLTGYSEAEAIGATPSILKSGFHSRDFYQKLWATLRRGQVFYAVFTNKKKSGELFAEQKTITPLRDESGKITHYISTGKDVTERQRAEARLEQVNRCFLNFSSDPMENIGRLTALCGTLLNATGAIYQRRVNERLDSVCTWGMVRACENATQESLEALMEESEASAVCPRLESPGDTWYEANSGIWRTLVRTGDRVVGLLSLCYRTPPEQTADDGRLLGIIATAIAIEEEQHRVGEALRRQMERERALSNLAHHIHRSLELSDILPATAKAVREFLKSDSVLIYALNETGTQAQMVAEATILETGNPNQILFKGFSFKTNCLRSYRTPQTRDNLQVRVCDKSCEIQGFENSKTHMIAPILQGSHLWGVIIAQNSQAYRHWTESEQEFLGQVSTQLGIATQQSKLYEELKIANSSLQNLATIDGLTQVANRRQFDTFLAQSWQRSLEQQKPLGIILCDIDFFKPYNDTYGHQAGDDCLKQVAGVISETVTDEDSLVARYGGEEFVVVINGAKPQKLVTLVQEIRGAVEGLRVPHRRSNAHPWVTLSVGAASLIPRREWTSDDLLRRADQALYQAKADGRNCGRIAEY